VRVFGFKRRHVSPVLKGGRGLLEKALSFCPEEEREAFALSRQRPRGWDKNMIWLWQIK